MSETSDIFKVAILSPEVKTYDYIKIEDSIFGYEFSQSFTETQGAAFGFAHFNVENLRLTAQFWALDAEPQWVSVRNLYLKKTSGLILLVDPKLKKWLEKSYKMLMEFISVNRYSVPILLLCPTSKDKKPIDKFKSNIERWTGYDIPLIPLDIKDGSKEMLTEFMKRVKNWRAKAVVFQTLKLYFSFDAIARDKRQISEIVKHLRAIYIARYIKLVDDRFLRGIIRDAALKEGFTHEDSYILYTRANRGLPHDFLPPLSIDGDLKKPNIKKIID